MDADVREVSGVARLRVLSCRKAGCSRSTMSASLWEVDVFHRWLIHLTCPACGTSWAACRTCKNTRAPFTDQKKLMRHRDNFHSHEDVTPTLSTDIVVTGTEPTDLLGFHDNREVSSRRQAMIDTLIDNNDPPLASEDVDIQDV
jgi:hypothetical protein